MFNQQALYEAKRAINGTFGYMYLDGELVRETTALKATVELNFLPVPMCGDLAEHKKVSGLKGKGNVTMTKVNSRMAILLSDYIKSGKTPTFTIISKLEDPDAFGAERVVLKGVQFESLSLVDWGTNKIGEINQPFTFTDWEFLDLIEPTF